MKKPSELTIPLETGASTTALVYAADQPAAALILGHGAGAGQRHPFMIDFAAAISALGIDVVTFNFLYTEQGRKLPDRGPALESCYGQVMAAVRVHVESARAQLFIGQQRCRRTGLVQIGGKGLGIGVHGTVAH